MQLAHAIETMGLEGSSTPMSMTSRQDLDVQR